MSDEGMSVQEYMRVSLEQRLSVLEGIVAAPGSLHKAVSGIVHGFEEALHPRGHDGRFIENGGHVSGTFQGTDGSTFHSGDAHVIGFKSTGASAKDPFVLVEDRNGHRGIAKASEVKTSIIKARLDGSRVAQISTPFVPSSTKTPAPVKAAEALTPDRITKIQDLPDKPIHVTDVNEAVRLLGEGKKIELDQPDQVSTLLDKLNEIVQEAKSKGEQAPTYDLCNVTATGTNLFCVDSQNIPRIEMPQLGGVPHPGSKADKLQRNDRGKVDLGPMFLAHLQAKGIKVTNGTTPASHMRASQAELDGAQTARLAKAIEDGTFINDSNVFTSRDNYVVDGHHRWAATVGAGYKAGEDINIPTSQVDMSIIDLLAEANKFAEDWGIGREGLGQNTDVSAPDVHGRGFQVRPGDVGPMKRDQVQRLSPPEVVEYINNAASDLSRDDPEARALGLDSILSGAFLSPLDSDNVHDKLGEDQNQWTAERMQLHEDLWSEIITKIQESGIPKEHDALVLGGLPGAGKSSTLKPGGAAERFGVIAWTPGEEPNPPNGVTHVSINPDAIKEMLIAHDAMPQGLEGIKPMEGETFIHEESSFLSKEFLRRLQGDGYNVVLDNTMETKGGMMKRMAPLAREGYQFRCLFADITPQESVKSARTRYKMTFKSPLGGRFVSSAVQGDRKPKHKRKSVNRNVFDDLAGIGPDGTVSGKGWFSQFIVVDNTGIADQNPLKQVTVDGTGDGSPAIAFSSSL